MHVHIQCLIFGYDYERNACVCIFSVNVSVHIPGCSRCLLGHIRIQFSSQLLCRLEKVRQKIQVVEIKVPCFPLGSAVVILENNGHVVVVRV